MHIPDGYIQILDLDDDAQNHRYIIDYRALRLPLVPRPEAKKPLAACMSDR